MYECCISKFVYIFLEIGGWGAIAQYKEKIYVVTKSWHDVMAHKQLVRQNWDIYLGE